MMYFVFSSSTFDRRCGHDGTARFRHSLSVWLTMYGLPTSVTAWMTFYYGGRRQKYSAMANCISVCESQHIGSGIDWPVGCASKPTTRILATLIGVRSPFGSSSLVQPDGHFGTQDYIFTWWSCKYSDRGEYRLLDIEFVRARNICAISFPFTVYFAEAIFRLVFYQLVKPCVIVSHSHYHKLRCWLLLLDAS